jgi:hypothetical protein
MLNAHSSEETAELRARLNNLETLLSHRLMQPTSSIRGDAVSILPDSRSILDVGPAMDREDSVNLTANNCTVPDSNVDDSGRQHSHYEFRGTSFASPTNAEAPPVSTLLRNCLLPSADHRPSLSREDQHTYRSTIYPLL